MRVDVLTVHPGMFQGPLDVSILKRAREKGVLKVNVVNIRDFAEGRHKVTDDEPYGGGCGMVMKPEPIIRALRHIGVLDGERRRGKVILLSAQGTLFHQALAKELAREEWLVLVCGHYEGVDERVAAVADEEISIGDYVLTGGELPALVVLDAVARLVPGVVGKRQSVEAESFQAGVLEGPQYTRPAEFEGRKVPDVLLSGDHESIRRWRRKQALKKTWLARPELFSVAPLTSEDLELLRELTEEAKVPEVSEAHSSESAS